MSATSLTLVSVSVAMKSSSRGFFCRASLVPANTASESPGFSYSFAETILPGVGAKDFVLLFEKMTEPGQWNNARILYPLVAPFDASKASMRFIGVYGVLIGDLLLDRGGA